MTPTIHPHSWTQFPIECFLYFSFLSVGHFIAFVVGGVLITAFSWQQRSLIVRRIRSWGLFLVLLLSMGALFNGVWSCSIWGRLYYSTDYVLDFLRFCQSRSRSSTCLSEISERSFLASRSFN